VVVTPTNAPAEQALELRHVTSGYDDMTVVRDVSLTVPRGGIVALLGANGAGKTTLLRVCAGLLRAKAGDIAVHGAVMTNASAVERARRGMWHVPEGGGVFRSLTVRENLVMIGRGRATKQRQDEMLELFPILRTRARQLAGRLSGGEQQILALARAQLAQPTIVLIDEVSLGLAPLVIDAMYAGLRSLSESGAAVLLVEQYVNRAVDFAESVYVLNHGTIAFKGVADDVDESMLAAEYLG
jgi:branched-chain amino acid transport system ATP-binding protein